MSREGSTRLARLMRLVGAIDEGRSSFEDLRRRVNPEAPPAVRTLRRYLAALHDSGFPWYFDRAAGVYRFDAGYSLRKLHLSSDELLGLQTMQDLAAALGGEIGGSIGGVTAKVAQLGDRRAKAAAGKPAVRLQIADAELDPERRATFAILRKAHENRQTVRFSYVDKVGKRSNRLVEPYGFVVSSGRVYLVAHDRRRGAKRVFALDGISEARIAPQRFVMPPDFDLEAFAARSVSGIMHAERPVRVRVRFSPVVARAARADRVVRERRIKELDGGALDITYTVADVTEFIRWTMKWGAEAEVMGPAAARREARALARAILARYAKSPKG